MVKSGATPESNTAAFWNGKVAWVTPEDLGKLTDHVVSSTRRTLTEEGLASCATSIAPVGSIVLSKRAPIGQTAILGVPAACNQGCVLLVPSQNTESRYYYYCLVAAREHLEMLGRGSTFMELSVDDLRDLRLPELDLTNQRLIADYLDAETASIDFLIAEKRRMLALMEEKLSTIVATIVTRGPNYNEPVKPSGQHWLGEIPLRWEVKRAKQLFAVRDDRSTNGDEELLSVSHLTGVTPRSEKTVSMFMAEDLAGYKLCRPGDLVVNTLWAWMGAMGVAQQHGIVSPDYHVYRPTGRLKSEFVNELCRSRPFIAEVTSRSSGVWSSRLRLYPEAFLDIRMPVPPALDQEAIVSALAQERDRHRTLTGAVNASILLLIERRRALILAAVTES